MEGRLVLSQPAILSFEKDGDLCLWGSKKC